MPVNRVREREDFTKGCEITSPQRSPPSPLFGVVFVELVLRKCLKGLAPFVDAFRTFCLSPSPEGQNLLLAIRQFEPLVSPPSTILEGVRL